MFIGQKISAVLGALGMVFMLDGLGLICFAIQSKLGEGGEIGFATLGIIRYAASKGSWLFELWAAWEFFGLSEWLTSLQKRYNINNHFHDIDATRFR